MRKREYHWSVYNSLEKNQLDGLRTDQVEVLFAAISKTDRAVWFVWKEGADAWRPLEDFPLLLSSLRKADDRVWETPPAPERTLAAEKTGRLALDDHEAPVDLALMDLNAGEDRHNVRFSKKVDVRILIGDTVHENKTVDISMKGMALKDPLPPGLPRYFNVELKCGSSTIPVVCSEIKNPDGSGAKRMRIEANEYGNSLFTFLLSGG